MCRENKHLMSHRNAASGFEDTPSTARGRGHRVWPAVLYSGRVSRRKGREAESAAIKAREARWRYLLRHPEFRADLREVLDLRPTWLDPRSAPYEAHKKLFDLTGK